ncbi:MAG: hypothetical protein ACOWWO_06225 [Peptococcaceae bacterium]
MVEEKGKTNPKSAKYWFEIAGEMNEELEQKREEFVRDAAQRPKGISADREKFPDGVKTGSYKRLPPNRHEENR